MEAFPAFYPLAGRRIVIAGEGDGAEAKARLFANAPARVDRVRGPAAATPETYAGAALAFVASPDPDACAAAAAAARSAGVAVNVVDHPELSDFHTPAIIDRGQVLAAIGTAGAAPIVAALLRAELEARIPPGLGRLAALFGELRGEIRSALPDLAERRAFLRAMLQGPAAQAADAGDVAGAEAELRRALGAGVAGAGRVWLIETPPARDLVSLRAARALAEAELLALGAGVTADLAALARRDAPQRALADLTAQHLADEAGAGRQVAVIAAAAELAPLAAALGALGVAVETLAPARSA